MIKKKEIKKEQIFKIRIKIVGIGGGGSSIVSEIASKVKRANFVVVNTDQQALKEIPGKIKRLQIGQKITGGLGTGMDAELGEKIARNETERIKEILKEQDLCILVACLGEGTGSGASPVFAEISRELKNITLGIFTLPFEFEGQKKMEIARASLEKLKPNLNAFIIIPNERILQIIDKETPLKQAFSTINKFLAENLKSLIEMIYSSGLINIDWADLKAILDGKEKLAYLNTIEAKKSDQPEEIARKVLSNPLYLYSAQGATSVLFNIDGGLNLSVDVMEQIGKTISNLVNPQAKIAFGITQNEKDKIKITLLANGCKWGNWEKKKPEEKPAELLKVPQPETSQTLVEEKPEAKTRKTSQ